MVRPVGFLLASLSSTRKYLKVYTRLVSMNWPKWARMAPIMTHAPRLYLGSFMACYQIMKRNKSNNKIVEEYKLFEYSFLTSWAANSLSTVQEIKNIKSHYGLMELITKAYDLPYSDTRLKQIEGILKALDNKEPDAPSTPTIEPLAITNIFKTLSWTK